MSESDCPPSDSQLAERGSSDGGPRPCEAALIVSTRNAMPPVSASLPGWKVYGRLDLNRWMGFARNWGRVQRRLAWTVENSIRVALPGGIAAAGA